VFIVRFPDINWIETCLVPELDEHKLVYTLSGFTRGVVQKDICVPGNNSVYPEDIDHVIPKSGYKPTYLQRI